MQKIAIASALALSLLLPTTENVRAEEASSPLGGSWRSAETSEQKEERLDAIEEATRSVPRFGRGKARGRLEKRTTPPESIVIDLDASKVWIGSGERGLTLELGAEPIEVRGDDGKAQVSATMEGERLVVTARGGKGGRVTTYSADGHRMTVAVTMTGSRLAGPLRYTTTYSRVE
jgi:hypothetical protein